MLRRVDKAGRVGSGPITAQAVFEAVVSYVRKADLGKITPHDLRRTFAKLAHLGRAPLEQIQISLGTLPSRLRSGIWAWLRTSMMHRAIGWGSWAGRRKGRGREGKSRGGE